MLALAVASRTGLAVAPLLERAGDGRRQVGRARSQRVRTPPRFTTVRPAAGPVVLIDDVVTTGATLGACAHALRDAGCTNHRSPEPLEGRMKIEVKGRNFAVTDEIRQKIEKRFEKVGKQVSELATLDIELSQERNPSIREKCVAEATLHLKGATLRAKDASESMSHTVNLVADELARQVKRHRDKRRGRRESARVEPRPAEG
jgi:putative sigma-54 modulation protein